MGRGQTHISVISQWRQPREKSKKIESIIRRIFFIDWYWRDSCFPCSIIDKGVFTVHLIGIQILQIWFNDMGIEKKILSIAEHKTKKETISICHTKNKSDTLFYRCFRLHQMMIWGKDAKKTFLDRMSPQPVNSLSKKYPI